MAEICACSGAAAAKGFQGLDYLGFKWILLQNQSPSIFTISQAKYNAIGRNYLITTAENSLTQVKNLFL
jgi:hypothetical protein